MRSTLSRAGFILLFAAAACASAAPNAAAPAGGMTRVAARDASPDATPREPLAWGTLDDQTFARAKAERRFVILDGAAEWCHWCHVMEAVTYHDPEVRRLLGERFIAVKVDVDARPDIEERYGAWGWPATVIFSPDAEELGKYKGYIEPERFAAILREVVEAGAGPGAGAGLEDEPGNATQLSKPHLAWVLRATALDLDEYWDPREGGWGRFQKAPLAGDNAFALLRARAGDKAMREKALTALAKQRALLDPVWGGFYQYSGAPDWKSPHFEKLLPVSAGALENYAEAYALTGDRAWLDVAAKVRAYLERFLLSPDGAFYATQDADLNAHERGKRFVDGAAYYALGEKERLALGIPRVDTHTYARESGLAIAAYAALYEATKDVGALGVARRAAKAILATHRLPSGGVTHAPLAEKPEGATLLVHLADNAAFAWGLLRLSEVSGDRELAGEARNVADFILRELADENDGGFFASTRDPGAVGVFARRKKPFDENVSALRLFARLARLTGEAGYARAANEAVRALATPARIKGRQRMLGDFLVALEEVTRLP